jgi:D-glycero-alpha-D-manno-heptose-7-phosphate kinase
MVIEARTPSRIDLAGGTLDIYPLYLLMEDGLTINMGITVGSYVRVGTRDDREVHITSQDTGASLSAPTAEELETGGPLDIVARAIRFYDPKAGLDVTCRNDAPRGSGLGASSSLLIATCGALRHLNGLELTDEQFVLYAANLETQNVRVPVGKQDYYAALYGGINAITFGVGGDSVEQIGQDEGFRRELERRLILCFTGEPRHSGATNWSMFRAYIDDVGDTRASLNRIKETARHMRAAVEACDFEAFAAALAEEWDNRQRLADGVCTPQIARLVDAAHEAGAAAFKICGAGGGGCGITLAADGTEGDVAAALEADGARVLRYRIARKGLEVRVGA